MWTRFMDMHSGGGAKEPQEYIYIEAPEAEASVIFYNRFGHSPGRVTCTCCGKDYSVSDKPTLEALTKFDRRDGRTLEEYLTDPEVLAIYAEDIKPEERQGEVPEQGYVWG